MVVEQDAFFLFLLFLQDPDLLPETVDRLPQVLGDAIGAADHFKEQLRSRLGIRQPPLDR